MPDRPVAQGERTRWPPLLLLALTIASAAAMRASFSPVQEMAKADLGLSDLQLSLVQGVAAAIPIALLSLPIGRLVDRSNRVRLLVALAATWTLGTALTVGAGSFATLFGARMLAGVGGFCVLPVAISLAADFGPAAQRGRAMMLLSFGNILGTAAAFGLGGWLFGALGDGTIVALRSLAPWRGMHVVFALASALLIAPLLLLREPGRHDPGEAAGAGAGQALRELWAYRRLLVPLFIGQVSVVMADNAAAVWAAPVLGRDYGQRPEQFAGWLGLAILLSGVLGAVVGGFAAELGQRSRRRNGILIGAVATAALSVPAGCFPLMPDVAGFGWMLGLLLLCGAATGLVTSAALTVLIPNEIRGLCLGAFIVFGAVIGLGIAPTLVSLVSALLGGEGEVRYALAVTTSATSLLAALGFAYALLGGAARGAVSDGVRVAPATTAMPS